MKDYKLLKPVHLFSNINYWISRISALSLPEGSTVFIHQRDHIIAFTAVMACQYMGLKPVCFSGSITAELLDQVAPQLVIGDSLTPSLQRTFRCLDTPTERCHTDESVQLMDDLRHRFLDADFSFSITEMVQHNKNMTTTSLDERVLQNSVSLSEGLRGKEWVVFNNLSFIEKYPTFFWALLDSDMRVYMYSGTHEEFVADMKSSLHRLKFGVFFFGSFTPQQQLYKPLLEIVRLADAFGFKAVWTPERHFNEFGGLFPNPAVLNAALAVLTKHVQIRSGSIVSPIHDTIRLAENFSVVDNLSQGRVAVSFAAGWQCDDFVFYPDRYSERDSVMLEQIEEVRRLWRGEEVIRRNGLEKEIKVRIFPKPVQQTLPVWITVSGKTETFVAAGRIGANILTHLLWQDKTELIDKIAKYRESLRENGYDPSQFKVAVMVHTFMAENLSLAEVAVRHHLKEYIRSSVFLIEKMVHSTKDASQKYRDTVGRYGNHLENVPDHLLDELLEISVTRFIHQAGIFGSVEDGLTMVRELRSYDVDEVACLVDFGPDQSQIETSLEYLNELRRICERDTMFLKTGMNIQMPLSDYQRMLDDVTTRSDFQNVFAGGLVFDNSIEALQSILEKDFSGIQIQSHKITEVMSLADRQTDEWKHSILNEMQSEL